MIALHQIRWDLTVVSVDSAAHAAAVASLEAAAAHRLADFGEQWVIEQQPEALTVKSSLSLAVDNLDAAG